jgi:hypothetical protein
MKSPDDFDPVAFAEQVVADAEAADAEARDECRQLAQPRYERDADGKLPAGEQVIAYLRMLADPQWGPFERRIIEDLLCEAAGEFGFVRERCDPAEARAALTPQAMRDLLRELRQVDERRETDP